MRRVCILSSNLTKEIKAISNSGPGRWIKIGLKQHLDYEIHHVPSCKQEAYRRLYEHKAERSDEELTWIEKWRIGALFNLILCVQFTPVPCVCNPGFDMDQTRRMMSEIKNTVILYIY